MHGDRCRAICPNDRPEQDRAEEDRESETGGAEVRLVAVLHEVEEHHGQHDHECDQKQRAENRVTQTALKKRPESDHEAETLADLPAYRSRAPVGSPDSRGLLGGGGRTLPIRTKYRCNNARFP